MTQHRNVVPKTEVSTNFYGSVTGIVDKAYIEARVGVGGGGGCDTNAVDALANSAVVTNALTVATTNRVAALETATNNLSSSVSGLASSVSDLSSSVSGLSSSKADKAEISADNPTFSNEVATVARTVTPPPSPTLRLYDEVRQCYWIGRMINGVINWEVE